MSLLQCMLHVLMWFIIFFAGLGTATGTPTEEMLDRIEALEKQGIAVTLPIIHVETVFRKTFYNYLVNNECILMF